MYICLLCTWFVTPCIFHVQVFFHIRFDLVTFIYNASNSKCFPANYIKFTILVLKLQILNFQYSWSMKNRKKHSKFLKNLWILVCNGKRKTVFLAIFCYEKKLIQKSFNLYIYTYIHKIKEVKYFSDLVKNLKVFQMFLVYFMILIKNKGFLTTTY